MRIYFGIHNIISFIHSIKDNRQLFEDCLRMIKDNLSIRWCFEKEEIERLSKDDRDDFYSWLRMMDSLSETPRWGDSVPNPINLSDWNLLTAIYCIDNVPQNKGLIVAHLGQELDAISSLLFDGNQFTINVFHDISKWDDLKDYSSPCTDIIIADPFVFSSPDLYDTNIYSILRELCIKTDGRINIVFFTLREDPQSHMAPDWDKIYEGIRSKCVKSKKTPKPNVTFVNASKKVLDEHDRTIFTNYKLYASGDSYNYFDTSSNRITKGRYLYINSGASKRNEQSAKKFIDDMQNIVNEIKKKANPSLIIKDKKSNVITF